MGVIQTTLSLQSVTRTSRTSALQRKFTDAINSASNALNLYESGRYKSFQDLDMHWLGFACLDLIAEGTQFFPSVKREEIITGLLEGARAQANSTGTYQALGEAGIKAGVTLIFDNLCNRSERYRPFSVRVFDPVDMGFTSRKFWLIKQVPSEDTRSKTPEVLLSSESYQLLFGLQEQEALDGARINALRIEMLVNRGSLVEAAQVADENVRQGYRLISEIKAIEREITRTIQTVDYDRIEYYNSEGLEQLTKLLQDINQLGNLVRNNQAHAEAEQLTQLSELAEKLNKQRQICDSLHAHIMQLPAIYREHEHKLFRKRDVFLGRTIPINDAISHIARLTIEEAGRLSDDFLAHLHYPKADDIFDPCSILIQLDKAIEKPKVEKFEPILEIENIVTEQFKTDFTDDEIEGLVDILIGMIPRNGALLSEWLKQVRDDFTVAHARVVQTLALVALDPDNHFVTRQFTLLADLSPHARSYQVWFDDVCLSGEEVLINRESNN